MRYRKNPIEVDATLWDGTSCCLALLVDLTGERFRAADDGIYTAEVFDDKHDTWIKVRTGDYIIEGIQGEFYPCERTVFEQTYTLA